MRLLQLRSIGTASQRVLAKGAKVSGWIRVQKELPDTMRFRRVVKALRESNALRGVTDCDDAFVATLVLGALARLWVYADSHIADDNTLAITLEEIDDLVGIKGFANALPADWLQVIDADNVQLPDFLEHNGTSAKNRRDAARRQATYRHRQRNAKVTEASRVTNARNDARPDQTRPDQTRPEKNIHTHTAREAVASRGTNGVTQHGSALCSSEKELRNIENGWQRDVDGVNVEALQKFFEHCETNLGKRYSASARIAVAKSLAGKGDLDVQQRICERSIQHDWKSLQDLPASGGGKPARVNGQKSRSERNQEVLEELNAKYAAEMAAAREAEARGEDVEHYAGLAQ
jgi:hypothetical protein